MTKENGLLKRVFSVFHMSLVFFFFSLGPVRITAMACTAALGLLCNPKYYIQLSFCSPVPRMRRQRSLTEAVRMSVGSTSRMSLMLM
jgi:hypothetical protein